MHGSRRPRSPWLVLIVLLASMAATLNELKVPSGHASFLTWGPTFLGKSRVPAVNANLPGLSRR